MPQVEAGKSPGERQSPGLHGIVARVLAMTLLATGTPWLAGCSLLPEPATELVATATAMPAPTATRSPTPPNPTLAPVDPSAPLTITLWLPPDMALGEGSTGQVMQELNRAFAAENPRVEVVMVAKARYGRGGLVNALLATQPVVPARMPDIVAFDTAELHKLAGERVISPLDALMPEESWQGLFPFALESVSVEGQKLAIPFQADISFLAYNSAMVSAPPKTWGDLSQAGAEYIFPAAEGDGSAADAFLLQYLAEGGVLVDNGRPYLDSSLVAGVLRSYRGETESGVVPGIVQSLGTLEDCWAIYLAGEAAMTNASSWQFWRDRDRLQRTRYAQIPTTRGGAITLARTWAWAVVTRDPVRQEAAASYVAFFLRPEYVSSWSKASFHLPVERSALVLAIEDEAYCAFLSEQLEYARPYPNMRDYVKIQEAIVGAIEDVLDGVSTPERAAVAAAATVQRLR